MPRTLALLTVPLLALSACDNVGNAFDLPNRNGGPGSETFVQRMVAGGVSVDGRPKVRSVFPKGGGWPGSVPIVVEFNETINEATVSPQGGTPSLYVRSAASGGGTPGLPTPTPTAIPASYDFFLGGRVVVIRPTTPFDTTAIEEFEVVATSELRDADGVRFASSGERVIATFTPDEADTVVDGEILTVLPVNNAFDQQRETSLIAIFTKAANQPTVTAGATGSFQVRAGGSIVAGNLSFPVRAVGLGNNQDGRIVQFVPAAALPASTRVELTVTSAITFGTTGELDFRGRTPFATFETLAPEAITSVTVGSPGAPDKVNAGNIASLMMDVDLPASTVAGDKIEGRIYGLDKKGGTTGAVSFVGATANAPISGAQTVTLDFAGKLGNAQSPGFLEGELTLAARLLRGTRSTGYVLSAAANKPALDVTAPTLASPAPDAGGNVVVFTDQERLVFWGQANEQLSGAALVLDSTPAPAPLPATGNVYGFGAGGRFMFDPIMLARRTVPIGFTLTLTDEAGNVSAPVTGTVVQRGVVTGALAGSVTVEAYDDATFQPVAGATVVVESAVPTKPATGRVTAVTGADGRASFTVGGAYTVTIVGAGYDLVSLVGASSAFVSLPLRPLANATATLRGIAAFSATPGARAMIGCNIIDDVRTEEILTTVAAPTAIPNTAVRPNRPFTVSAFTGVFEPTSKPTFQNFACSICGATGLVKEAMQAPIAPGATRNQNLVLLPAALAARDLAASYTKDLSTWGGLDAANLVDDPTVRVMASLFGIPGMTLVGVGFADVTAGTTYSIDATYSTGIAGVIATLGPKFWVTTEATDTAGNIARHRRIILNTAAGTTFASAAVPGVPTITAPGGPSTGAPQVTYQDRLDATVIPTGHAFQILNASDATGRRWRILQQDLDGAVGAASLQIPDLTGVAVTGLATGTWAVFGESVLLFNNSFGAGDYVLEEMRREEVTYTRSTAQDFTVN